MYATKKSSFYVLRPIMQIHTTKILYQQSQHVAKNTHCWIYHQLFCIIFLCADFFVLLKAKAQIKRSGLAMFRILLSAICLQLYSRTMEKLNTKHFDRTNTNGSNQIMAKYVVNWFILLYESCIDCDKAKKLGSQKKLFSRNCEQRRRIKLA